MTWTTSKTELRELLSDGDTDKLRWRKKILGQQDGTNKNFKTFEDRRVTDLSTATGVTGVFVDDVAATVDSDDPISGQFTLHTAPSNTALIEATYYQRWFTDTELDAFLTSASNWLGAGSTTNIPSGLQPAALKYAAAEAYQKLALKWAQNFSDEYKMQDQDPENKPIKNYMDLSGTLRADATKTRDEFYTRQGRALQPLSANVIGTVPTVGPNR